MENIFRWCWRICLPGVNRRRAANLRTRTKLEVGNRKGPDSSRAGVRLDCWELCGAIVDAFAERTRWSHRFPRLEPMVPTWAQTSAWPQPGSVPRSLRKRLGYRLVHAKPRVPAYVATRRLSVVTALMADSWSCNRPPRNLPSRAWLVCRDVPLSVR